MLRREPLYTAIQPAVMSSGLQPDLHPLLSLLWEAAANVQFFSGKVRRRTPAATMYNVGSGSGRGLSQQQSINGTRWAWSAFHNGTTLYTYRWYGPAHEAISSHTLPVNETSSAPAAFVDFTHYGDWTIINDTVNPPYIFKPPAGVVVYGDAPAGAAQLLKKLSFIMAFGYGSRGTRVGWSDSSNIEDWTATAINDAGSLTIDEFNTRIKAAQHLGTSIAVYAEDQMALVNYIGGSFVFGYKFALDGIGACGKLSVASTGKEHFGVGRGGVWWTDGLSYKYIDEGFLHDYLQDNVNWAQQSKIVACRNDYTGCIDFSFPMLGSGSTECTEGWSFDPRSGGWTPIPAFSCKDERRLFDKPILATSTGLVQRDQDSPAGVAPLTLRTKPLLMQVGGVTGPIYLHVASRIDEIVLMLKAEADVEMRIGSAMTLDEAFVWSGWMALGGGATTYLRRLDWPADGVYWKLDFRSTSNSWNLDLQGFMLFGSVEGTARDAA